jgi:hypothetical protein
MEIVYHLTDQRSPLKQALAFLIVGAIFSVLGFVFFSGILGWLLKGAGVLSLLIGGAYYFNRNTAEALLTEDSLVIRSQAGEKTMLFAEMQKIELTFVKEGKTQKKGLYSLENIEADEKTVLTISDGGNKRLEVAAKDFDLNDYVNFLQAFQANGQGNLLQETDRIKALIKENETYLQQDTKLKISFEQGLLEAYKAVYVQRGEFYKKENPQAQALYVYDKNPNNVIYFMDNDYLPNLNGEGLQTAKILLVGTEKNISIVDTRIASFKEIASKLKTMEASNQNKLQMRKATGKLESLAMKNQLTEFNDFDRKELLLQIETVKQLQQITTEMNGLDDLDRAKSLLLQTEMLLK